VIWHNVMEELFSDPKFERLLAEPYPGGKLPLEFMLPAELVKRKICQLPGSFNGYAEELFSPAMIKRAEAAARGSGQTPGPDDQLLPNIDGCDVYKEMTLAQLGDVPVSADGEGADQLFAASGKYCMPVDGMPMPQGMLVTVKIWSLPPLDPDEKVTYSWEGGGGVAAENIPPCTPDLIASVAPPGSVRMPDLRKLGENQAKDQLAALGIYNVYVDYQTRDRIPDVFDSYGPYVVLSTLPAPGDWIHPGETVVLGIRAPEDQPAPPAEPPPPEGQPPAPTGDGIAPAP